MDTVLVNVVEGIKFVIPNAFTPDGNEHNDLFRPLLLSGSGKIMEFRVYDRWGELLYQCYDCSGPYYGWNGKKGDQEMPRDTYIYYVKFADKKDIRYERHGDFVLIR
jgi:gliding motility-associated-like protein